MSDWDINAIVNLAIQVLIAKLKDENLKLKK
jgi:hypothetical protein